MSRRDLVHVLDALGRLSRGEAEVGVPLGRPKLNLESLNEEGLAVRLADGGWALTPQGVAWLKQDRELSGL